MGTIISQLKLFPLALVLLPEELLGLHIFEERYKRMIARCRAEDAPFGVVLRVDEGLAAVGCTARLAEVIEEFPDGRLNIAVRGERAFRLLEIDIPDDPDQEPLEAKVELLEETEEGDEQASEAVADLVLRFHRAQAEIDAPEGAGPGEAPLAEPSSERPSSFTWARGLDIGVVLKQRLLESTGEGERLALLRDYLEMLVVKTEVLATRQDAIRGNGKGD